MNARPVLNAQSRLRPILIVEDNDMDLDLCLQAFVEHGVANPVLTCPDGERALAYIDAHQEPEDPAMPLLVLLDLRLPKVDGTDVIRHARAHRVWGQVPIVVLTTSNERSDVAAAYESGANSYIVKPVDFGSFAEVVRHIHKYWILTNEPPFQDTGGR